MTEFLLHRRNLHLIFPEEPHDKSLAAHMLLKQHYREIEDTPWKRQVVFNTDFLIKKQKETGTLTCVYCQKKNLVINCKSLNFLATADHVVPISRGGGAFDESNLVVACHHCNNRKGASLGIKIDDQHYTFNTKEKNYPNVKY